MTEFEILAEISIGLIGFAGVVVALGRSSLSSTARRFHLVMLFANGAAAMWGSISPTLAGLMLGPDSSYMVLACLMYLPTFIFVNIYAWRIIFRFYSMSEATPTAWTYTSFLISAVSLFYMLAAVIMYPSQISPSMYASISLLLFMGLSHFYSLVTAIPNDEQDAA